MNTEDKSSSMLKRSLAAIEKLRHRVQELEQSAYDPIAIIGIGCRFPDAVTGPDAFWKFLKEGKDGVGSIPAQRWDYEQFYHPEPGTPGTMYIGNGSFVSDVDQFDASFFGISLREAQSMDPQQRLFLTVCWEALENAGINPLSLEGSLTGVFAGVVNQDYAMMQMKHTPPDKMDTYFATGHPHCVVSGRVSYFLGLRGPNFTLDTACSSSLVALDAACQNLRSGTCNVALSGGVNLLLMPEIYMARCQARMLSPSGRCKTFDIQADGYIPGEGCGVVVLKRLSDAIRDGDRIDALVRDICVNHDGKSNGLTVPSGEAQRALYRRALARTRLKPAQIGYIEAHGTGTKLGDPIEMHSIQDVYCKERTAHAPLYVGSVKTNYGHMESAAGICGLIKSVLALKHEAIPPHLHFDTINPHINLHPATVIPTQLVPWRRDSNKDESPRCAAVSSFGMSGTNAHVILQEAPNESALLYKETLNEPESNKLILIPLSAKTEQSLKDYSVALKEYLSISEQPALADIQHTLLLRAQHRHSMAIPARSVNELVTKLTRIINDEYDPSIIQQENLNTVDTKSVFVFSGQGSQWVSMGKELINREAIFKKKIEEIDHLIRKYNNWSLLDELAATQQQSHLDQVDVIQPCIFAIQVALVALWEVNGVMPEAVIGHSMGEVAAAHVAGILTLDDAVCIIAQRSKIAKRSSGKGSMALVELSYAEIQSVIEPYQSELAVAAQNNPNTVVLSGATSALDRVLETLSQRDIFCRPIKVDYASHSPQMDPLRDDLLVALQQVKPRLATIPFYSTVTVCVEDGLGCDADYWVNNICRPVLFWPTIEQLVEDEHNLFIEISPHPVLLPSIKQGLNQVNAAGIGIASLLRDCSEEESFTDAMGQFYCAGGKLASISAQPPRIRKILDLPTYAWTYQSCWFDRSISADSTASQSSYSLLQRFTPVASSNAQLWTSRLNLDLMPSLSDHRVNTMIVIPGAVYVEWVLQAVKELKQSANLCIDQLDILNAMVLQEEATRVVQISLSCWLLEEERNTYSFSISSYDEELGDRAVGPQWIEHCQGSFTLEQGSVANRCVDKINLEVLRGQLPVTIQGEEHYKSTLERGLEYGPAYQSIKSLSVGIGQSVAELTFPEAIKSEIAGCIIHPSILDGCFQLADSALKGFDIVEDYHVYLPSCIKGLHLYSDLSSLNDDEGVCAHFFVNTAIGEATTAPLEISSSLSLTDSHGNILLKIDQFIIRKVESDNSVWKDLPSQWFYQTQWQVLPGADSISMSTAELEGGLEASRESWLVFENRSDIDDKLVCVLQEAGLNVTRVRKGKQFSCDNGVYTIDPHSIDDYQALFAQSNTDVKPCSKILYLWGQHYPADDVLLSATESVVYLVQALVNGDRDQVPQLCLITAGAVAALPMESVDPFQSPLWSIARVLSYEHSELKTRSCDLPAAKAERQIDMLVSWLLSNCDEEQVAFRNVNKYCARLHRYSPAMFEYREIEDRIGKNACYLITGGLGGLGLKVASMLAKQGVQDIVLLGRSKPDQITLEAIDHIKNQGVRIFVLSADVSNRTDLEAVFSFIKKQCTTLKGIVHCAGVLDDGAIVNLTQSQFRSVLAAKVAGAWNLHQLTSTIQLENFIFFSSVASMLGAPGQANYAVANGFMDGLALHRQATGLPALCINWGAFSDIGLAASGENRIDRLHARGIPGIKSSTGMRALELVLPWKETALGIFPFPFSIWRELNPQIANMKIFADIAQERRYQLSQTEKSNIKASLADLSGSALRDAIELFLNEQIALVLKVRPDQIESNVEFKSIGYDSLMAIELRNRLEAGLSISLSSTLIWKYPTPTALKNYLAESLCGSPVETPRSSYGEQVIIDNNDTVIANKSTGWLVCERKNPQAELRLFCFPHGGAGASAFNGWHKLMPEECEVYAIQPSGREERLNEQPELTMRGYIDAVMAEMRPLLDKPFVVFGYSLGGLTGYATISRIRQQLNMIPEELFVSSCFAPHIPFEQTTLSKVSTEQSAMKAMAFYQSTPDSIFRDPEMRALLARSIEADNSVVASYDFVDDVAFDCPITVYAGVDDDLATVAEQKRWQELTDSQFNFEEFEGDHFFYLRNKQPVISALRRRLSQLIFSILHDTLEKT